MVSFFTVSFFFSLCFRPLYLRTSISPFAWKVVLAIVFMSKEGTLLKSLRQWSLADSLIASGLPAAIYALQNSLLQVSYRNLDSLTFSMLNQTKIFFTALFMYIILRFESDTHYLLVPVVSTCFFIVQES